MSGDDTTGWLTERGRKGNLTVPLAKQLAAESQRGWYVAHHGHDRFVVGRMTLQKLSSGHIVIDDQGNPLTFASVAQAKAFLRDELEIHSPQVFDF
jgi:hypothetical protein